MFHKLTIIKDDQEVFSHGYDGRDWTQFSDIAHQHCPCTILLSEMDGTVFQTIHISKAK